MGKDDKQRVTVMGKPLVCLVCGNDTFTQRTIKMNTTGAALWGVEAFNKGSDGAICTSCTYVHQFAGKSLSWG